MVYSSGAAIHAIILALLTSQLVPGATLENHGSVQIELGRTIPVIPGAIEGDTDAILAIVGTAFLALAPMQVWSSTFKNAEQKTILILWSLLVFIGFLCVCISGSYVYYWSFPQLRFCPVNANDTLPISASGTSVFNGAWNHLNRNHWNETVTLFFNNTTTSQASVCYYPSLDYIWPLRDHTEIIVTSDSNPINTWVGFWMLSALWFVVALSAASSLIMVCFHGPWQHLYDRDESYRTQLRVLESAICTWPHFSLQSARVAGGAISRLLIHAADTYAKYLSGLALVTYVVFTELLLKYDPPGESFIHIGQWGAVAGTVVVLIAVLVNKLLETYCTYGGRPMRQFYWETLTRLKIRWTISPA